MSTMSPPTIHAIFIGQPKTITDTAGTWTSAIFRETVHVPVEVTMRGLVGDTVADTKHHGSPDQAVCCHPLEHYEYWNGEYNLRDEAAPGHRPVGPGGVGENWTIARANEQTICVGDIYRVGSARVQVAGPRVPCSKQERKLGLPDFLNRTRATMRTGFYLRVLAPGVVQPGDALLLEARPNPHITVLQLCRGYFYPETIENWPDFFRQVIVGQGVSQAWVERFQRKLDEAA